MTTETSLFKLTSEIYLLISTTWNSEPPTNQGNKPNKKSLFSQWNLLFKNFLFAEELIPVGIYTQSQTKQNNPWGF